MRLTREQGALAASLPLMIAGLVAVALAETWLVRLGGAAMVAGGALALATENRRARWLGWGLAALGAAVTAWGLT